MLHFTEMQMQANDETTAVQFQKLFVDKGHPTVFTKPILTSREKLGWTFPGSTYCQIILNENKQRHLKLDNRTKG